MEHRQQDIFKIVLTGPESTGKTTLAQRLALELQTSWVPEFARYFVANLGRPYRQEDLSRIGRGQKNWEQWYAMRARSALICDTDWTVLQIWEQYKFQEPRTGLWDWEKGYAAPQNADLYLLCTPDFPWQPDRLRETPNARPTLFNQYKALLQDAGATYISLEGSLEHRLEQALTEIRKFL